MAKFVNLNSLFHCYHLTQNNFNIFNDTDEANVEIKNRKENRGKYLKENWRNNNMELNLD